MANSCKYYKQQRQVSYDGGVSWQNLNEFQKGELYERDSSSCGYMEVTRWVTTGTTCQGYDKYNVQVKEISYDGGTTWNRTTETQNILAERNSTDCGYVPPTPTSGDYLTFTAVESGAFSFSGYSVSYSLDDGATWNQLTSTYTPVVEVGNSIKWKSNYSLSSYEIGTFSSTNKFSVGGNVMSLLYGDDFTGHTDLSDRIMTFGGLFANCSGMTSAEYLSLPATTLGNSTYLRMFSNCTGLTTPPQLPATTLGVQCYRMMFANCRSLVSAPALPVTTLADRCYAEMFQDCRSLTSVPSLPATVMTEMCYEGMFAGCYSLTTVPTNYLPSTSLANNCYEGMFQYCTGLTQAPELPAMSLTEACYSNMFANCYSLATAPVLPAATLRKSCYMSMFMECSSLTYVKCLATDISAEYCTSSWFLSSTTHPIPDNGTFVKAASMNSWTRGSDGILPTWTVQNA